jgi:hypothetical protein
MKMADVVPGWTIVNPESGARTCATERDVVIADLGPRSLCLENRSMLASRTRTAVKMGAKASKNA